MSKHQHPRESDTNGGQQGGPVQESHGRHGGNHGGDQQRNDSSHGASRRGDEPNAESKNTGGGSDNERAQPTQKVKEKDGPYPNAGNQPSTANDGGTIDDAENRDAQ